MENFEKLFGDKLMNFMKAFHRYLHYLETQEGVKEDIGLSDIVEIKKIENGNKK